MEQIVSKELMFKRGAEAARQGKPRDDHGMHSWVTAVADWQAGHDYVTKARQKLARGQVVGGQP